MSVFVQGCVAAARTGGEGSALPGSNLFQLSFMIFVFLHLYLYLYLSNVMHRFVLTLSHDVKPWPLPPTQICKSCNELDTDVGQTVDKLL